MKELDDRKMKVPIVVLSVLVLLVVSSIFGFLENIKGMGLAIVAGSLGLAFANIDRLKKFKAGGIEAETWLIKGSQSQPDDVVEGVEEEIVNPLLENLDLKTEDDRRKAHSRIRAAHREVYLAHTLAPTKIRGMLYNAFIYVRPSAGGSLEDVKEATFFLGKGFGNQVFKGEKNQDGTIGIGYSVHGEFFCTCLVTFKDGEEIMLERYIDFDMGEWIE